MTPEAEQNAMLERLLSKHIRTWHRTCEDAWYSCPLSEEGCANEADKECTCGLDGEKERMLAFGRELLQAVQERERWISVEEKLPCPDSAVLIVLTATDKNKTFASQERVFWGYFEGRKDQPTWQHDDKNAESEFWKVTHWRPLPKPPGEAQTYADLFQEEGK